MSDNDRSMIFEFIFILLFVVGVSTLAISVGTPTGNDKIYIYDVDFYETMTVTEKEIIK